MLQLIAYVVTQIGVHQDNVVACALRQAVNIGRAETHLAGSAVQSDLARVRFLEFLDNILGAVGAVIVNDHDLHVQVAVRVRARKRLTDHGPSS